jgi:polar amino acid transport system substrate-binding protein
VKRLLLIPLFVALLLSAQAEGWNSVKDLAEARWGVFTGTVFDTWVQKNYPKAVTVQFSSPADALLALSTKKVDTVLVDIINGRLALKSNPDLAILDTDFFNTPIGVGFRKEDDALRERFNAFLARIRQDGTYREMKERWIEGDPEKAMMPSIARPRGGEKVRLAVSVADMPYVAHLNGEYVGFDIELMLRFAEQEKLDMEIITMDFSALIAALAAGKADIITDGISISEERKKMIDFSDPTTEMVTAALVRKADLSPTHPARNGLAGGGTAGGAAAAGGSSVPEKQGGFFSELKAGFVRNLILEKRWKLIVDGLGRTVVISILSTIFGTIVGAAVCWMRMSGRRVLRSLAGTFISILRGMPVLVILMIIFYIVFASVDIDPVVVAVIAFGLNFGAYVSEMFRTGIEGVEKGQTEAGIAMGFSKLQTFVNIVAPQAARRILPVYRGEFISLVKTTSIVGYIGVQDLTKAGDIIRSRTFDAFFPLIMVALIYFGATWFLGLFLDYLDARTDPRARRASGGRKGARAGRQA